MNQIMLAAKTDCRSWSHRGRAWMILAILGAFPLVSCLLIVLVGLGDEVSDVLVGLLTGSCFGLMISQLVDCFFNFDGPEGNLFGLMPVQRKNQILGRYLYLHLTPLGMGLGFILMVFTARAYRNRVLDFSGAVNELGSIVLAGLALLALGMVFLDLCLPLFYRNTATQAMLKIFTYAVGLIVLGLLIAQIPLDWSAFLSEVLLFFSANTWRTMLIGLALLVVIDLVSKYISRQAYLAKDL